MSSAAMRACLEDIAPPPHLDCGHSPDIFKKLLFSGGGGNGFSPGPAQGQTRQHSQLANTGPACVAYSIHLPAGLKGTNLPVLFHEEEGGVGTRLACPGRLPGGLAFWGFFQPDLGKLLESN